MSKRELRDSEYNMIANAWSKTKKAVGIGGNKLDQGAKTVGNEFKAGNSKANMEIEKDKMGRKVQSQADMMINHKDYNLKGKRAAAIDAVKKNTNIHRVGGGAAGAVVGGAAGVGIAALTTGKKRKRIGYLTAKGELNTRERAELAQLKRSVKTRNIVGAAVGTLAGAAGGAMLGNQLAKKKNLKTLRSFNREKSGVVNDVRGYFARKEADKAAKAAKKK